MSQEPLDLIKLQDYYDSVRKEVHKTFSVDSIFDIIFAGEGGLIIFNVSHDHDDEVLEDQYWKYTSSITNMYV